MSKKKKRIFKFLSRYDNAEAPPLSPKSLSKCINELKRGYTKQEIKEMNEDFVQTVQGMESLLSRKI